MELDSSSRYIDEVKKQFFFSLNNQLKYSEGVFFSSFFFFSSIAYFLFFAFQLIARRVFQMLFLQPLIPIIEK